MKILLIFPPKERFIFSRMELHKKIDEESGTYPPLGLLYVAAYAMKHLPGAEVSVIDASAENMSYAALDEEIRRRKPDIVGIYFCTIYLMDGFLTASLVKKADRNTVVVAGGPHVFLYPSETLASPDVDYCVYGEGEEAFARLAARLASSGDPENIPGVLSRKNTGSRAEIQKIADLDSLPFPARRLLDVRAYKSFITYSNPITTMMTSRGCAYNCYYCNNIERAQKVRFRSAANVADEIAEITGMGVRDIIFFDENFTFDINRVAELCGEIASRKLRVRWHCRSRADMKLDRSVLRKMKDAGCRLIQFGVESGSGRIQKIINKKLDLENLKKTVAMVKEEGILAYGNFMLGLPSETPAEMERTIEFAKELDLDYAPFSIFNPMPESVFYLNALRDGVIKKDYWLDYARNPDGVVEDFGWPEFDLKFLSEMNIRAFREFYLRPGYILKSIFRRQSLGQKLWQIKSAVRAFC